MVIAMFKTVKREDINAGEYQTAVARMMGDEDARLRLAQGLHHSRGLAQSPRASCHAATRVRGVLRLAVGQGLQRRPRVRVEAILELHSRPADAAPKSPLWKARSQRSNAPILRTASTAWRSAPSGASPSASSHSASSASAAARSMASA